MKENELMYDQIVYIPVVQLSGKVEPAGSKLIKKFTNTYTIVRNMLVIMVFS